MSAAAKGTYKPRSMDPTKHKDFEIAKEAMKFLPGPDEWAEKLGLLKDEVIPYGRTPKLDFIKIMNRLKDKPDGKYVEVTAITPTPLGEGKTTVSMGLVQGLGVKGINVGGALRQPSGGPTMNVKGTAAGGGNALLIPMTEFSLGLTGDINDIMNAHNLAMVALTSRLQHECNYTDEELTKRGLRRLDIDPKNVEMGWVIDFCAQALRKIMIGLGRQEGRLPDGVQVRHRGRLGADGDPRRLARPGRHARPHRQDHRRLRPHRQADHDLGPRRRRRDDRLDAQHDQPDPLLLGRGPAGADPRRPVREHRDRPELDHLRPPGAQALRLHRDRVRLRRGHRLREVLERQVPAQRQHPQRLGPRGHDPRAQDARRRSRGRPGPPAPGRLHQGEPRSGREGLREPDAT